MHFRGAATRFREHGKREGFRTAFFASMSALVLACRPASPPPSTPAPKAETPDGVAEAPTPAPSLAGESLGYVGTIEPETYPTQLRAEAVEQGRVGSMVGYRLVLDPRVAETLRARTRDRVQRGEGAGTFTLDVVSESTPIAAIAEPLGIAAEEMSIWILVKSGEKPPSDLRLLVGEEGSRGFVFLLRTSTPGSLLESTSFSKSYRDVLLRHLASRSSSPFQLYAVDLVSGGAGNPEGGRSSGLAVGRDSLLSETMRFWSGEQSLELAILEKRAVPDVGPGKVKLASLRAPTVPLVDFRAMVAALGGSVKLPALYSSVPAEFYVLRAVSGKALVDAMNEMRRVGFPMVRLMESSNLSAEISSRYLTMLGLREGALLEKFGPSAIEEVAVVGSDLFLRKGSDVTAIFVPKNEALLEAGLALSLAQAADGHSDVKVSEVRATPRVTLKSTSDGAVHRYEAKLGKYLVVGNSLAAIERIASTFEGKHESLSKEADFQYMMTRDEKLPSDVLFYAGDRFFREMASPRSRVLDARRNLALVEMKQVGYAQLTGALLGEGSALSMERLVRLGLLGKSKSAHFDGAKLTTDPHGVVSSKYGTPRSLTPLLELETPTTVSRDEAAAYALFAEEYSRLWSGAIDPFCLRATFSESGVKGNLRVFPIVFDGDVRSGREFVGSARFAAGKPVNGLRFSLGISEQSDLRRGAEGVAPSFIGERIDFDWIGSVVSVGVLDDERLVTALGSDLAPRAPGTPHVSSGLEDALKLPLFASIAVKSRAKAQLFVDLLRTLAAKQVAVRFREYAKIGEVSLVEVAFEEGGLREKAYFALGKKSLYLTLQPDVLETLLRREEQGIEPGDTELPLADTSQLDLSLAFAKGSALRKIIVWAYESENRVAPGELAFAREGFRALATENGKDLTEYYLRHFGTVPLSRDGLPLVMSPWGLVEPERGNLVRRTFPNLPVEGSDLGRLLGALEGASAGMLFEPEVTMSGLPVQESLRVRFELRTAPRN